MNEKARAVAEGTEVYEDGGMLLTGAAIDHFAFVTLISSYILEIRTGMRATRIPLSRVAAQYGVTARNKKTALRQLVALYEETYGRKFYDKRLEGVL